ncbi:MAG: SDR family NAD(P)-dependent oxidoreductase [Rhodospirillales bacterium]|nr:SDR family NAD(P)-dependent oxidoreductase [Rhodospirillales bacterium]MDE2574651.1 SDR family NAD(P)-dependent oxidoreductase [Rhodospirillales bacterium]
MTDHLLIFGLGYAGAAVARAAVAAGMTVTATSRDPAGAHPPPGVRIVGFEAAEPAVVTHVLATAPPGEAGDPVLAAHGAALRHAPHLRWAGYLSTTGVYGDRQGGWVSESTPPAPSSERARRRVAAEAGWAALAGRVPVDIFRVAGIYGPGRSPFDELRAGRARAIVKPGHAFGRIHRDDIARAVLAAARQERAPWLRVLNLADDEPAESAVVLAEAAGLLGVAAPAEVPYAEAEPGMSDMQRSFWAENRRVSSARTQTMLGLRWLYPTFREGLRAILREEAPNNPV